VRLNFGKSKWEMWDDPLETFLQRVRESGFDATEIYLGSLHESPAEITRLHHAYGLRLIGQILTQGQTYRDHIKSLESQIDFAAQCELVFINIHTGRDIFSFEENIQIYQRLTELSQRSRIPIAISRSDYIHARVG
jgi:sugar phosphate isomerase/epimerase